MKTFWPKGKLLLLVSIIVFYLALGLSFKFLVSLGMIDKLPARFIETGGSDDIGDMQPRTAGISLESAQSFFSRNFLRKNGHVDLHITVLQNRTLRDNRTNSEAVSYYLLWKANDMDKQAFDRGIAYLNSKMAHPSFGYMMWRLEPDDTIVDDGSNIATDADLRAIKALLIAEKQWGDKEYTQAINQLAAGLEKLAITNDGLLAPYAGVSGETSVWKADEVWLSYSDFSVFKELSKRRGEPWTSLYQKMKNAVLKAQIANGLYNSMLTERREYGNGIDGGGYSINSMWIMVRNSESGDDELRMSANKSLQFYKQKFEQEAELYSMYSSNGDAMSPSDTPWVYALVGRAAIGLGDSEFSQKMIEKLVEHQDLNPKSVYYGAFLEGNEKERLISQFTLQESILTIQDFLKSKNQFRDYSSGTFELNGVAKK